MTQVVEAVDGPLLIFTPSGRRGHFPVGTLVLDAARSLGVDIDSVCGGRGICGRCQVRPMTGSFTKHGIESSAEHLAAPGAVEADYELTRAPLTRAVACLAPRRCLATSSSTCRRRARSTQVVRKGIARRAFTVDPVVRLHYVEVVPLSWPRRQATSAACSRRWSASGR